MTCAAPTPTSALTPAQVRAARAISRQCAGLLAKDRKHRARDRKDRKRAKAKAAKL